MKVRLLRTSGEPIDPQLIEGFEQVSCRRAPKIDYVGNKEETELLAFIFSLNALYGEIIVDKIQYKDGNEVVYVEIYDDYRE